jgi:hypothetical protein
VEVWTAGRSGSSFTTSKETHHMSDHHKKQCPSFMEKVRAIKAEHALCAVDRNGATMPALHATTGDNRFVLCCGRCKASWTLVLTADDARELDEYVRKRRREDESHDGE